MTWLSIGLWLLILGLIFSPRRRDPAIRLKEHVSRRHASVAIPGRDDGDRGG